MKSDSAVLNDVRALQQAFKERRDLYSLKLRIYQGVREVILLWEKKKGKVNKRIATDIEDKLFREGLRFNYHIEGKEIVVWGGPISYEDRMTIKLTPQSYQTATGVVPGLASEYLQQRIQQYGKDIQAMVLAESVIPEIVGYYTQAKEALERAGDYLVDTPFKYLVPELP